MSPFVAMTGFSPDGVPHSGQLPLSYSVSHTKHLVRFKSVGGVTGSGIGAGGATDGTSSTAGAGAKGALIVGGAVDATTVGEALGR